MLTGTLVMIAGFIPIGFAQSSSGEYCYSMFMVVLISLSASWIVAVLFSPLLGTLMLPKTMPGHGHGKGRVMRAQTEMPRVARATVAIPRRRVTTADFRTP